MKKFLMSVALVAAIGMAAQAADKKGGGSKSSNSHSNYTPSYSGGSNTKSANSQKSAPSNMQHLTAKNTSKTYHLTHGEKHDFGWCFKGYNHDHWTCRCWSDRCGCYCNWCPCTCCWFYFCVPDGCWYPVSYCPYGCYVF
jgi:hypothetical protein